MQEYTSVGFVRKIGIIGRYGTFTISFKLYIFRHSPSQRGDAYTDAYNTSCEYAEGSASDHL